LDRNADFDRSFRPRRRLSRGRLASLRSAFPDGNMPPIEVQELGGSYFVADGHHRVALARELGADFIDAEVTRLQTNYEVGPDVDVCQLVHTEQQRMFLEESGLGRARPDAVIEFSRPGGYPELLELVKAHGYDLSLRRDALQSREDVAADWHDHVYRPGVDGLRRESLPEMYAYKTDTDLFLRIYQRRLRAARHRGGDRLRRRRPRRPRPAGQPQLPPRLPAREGPAAAAARLLVGLAATSHAKSRAPITVRRRPRPSKSQRDSFGSASLPDGAGIPGFHTQRHRKTH
jgi:hypothetical protein